MNSQSGTYYNTEGQFFGDWSTIPPFGDALLDIDEVPQLSSDWSPSASPHQADSDSTDLSTSLVLLSDNTTGASPKSNPRKRRGHTKSRLGCVHCKKRKIKCQETWPSCANCERRGIACEYPTVFNHAQHDRIVSEVLSSPRPLVQLSATPTKFSANDMRLFHHFLITAHPTVPHQFEPVWVRDMPTFSHTYGYLMQAIFAFAGSHMNLLREDSQGDMALYHRQNAIKGLNEAFSRWPPEADEAHAMLATSLLLAFQSGFMPDGLTDHILSLRGCNLLTQAINQKNLKGPFIGTSELQYMVPEVEKRDFAIVDQDLVWGAFRSLQALAPLIQSNTTKPIEKQMYESLYQALVPLMVNPPPYIPTANGSLIAYVEEKSSPNPDRASLGIEACFNVLTTWPQEDVFYFLDPSNMLSTTLMAHFAAIRFLDTALVANVDAMKHLVKALVEWCEGIVGRVRDDEDTEWAAYVRWPSVVIEGMRWCIDRRYSRTGRHDATVGDMKEMLINHPEVFAGVRPVCGDI